MSIVTSPSAESQIALSNLSEVGLPRDAYVGPEWYQSDVEQFFLPRWHYVGHISELAKAGDFIRFDFADYSVIVTKNRAGEVQALHNVCRHRGSRLVDEERGHCKRAFVCQYHGWSYGHDGELIGAPKMQGDFDKTAYPLKRAAVDVWNGLVFVNLSSEVSAGVGELLAAADLGAYQLENTRVAWDEKKLIKCNWKVLWENGLECYHCAINHPEVSKVVRVERDGPINITADVPVGDFDWTNDYPLVNKSLTIDGEYAVKKMLGDPEDPPTKASYLSWHRGTLEVVVLPDYVKITNYKPIDATTTESRVIGLVRSDAEEGVDFDMEHLRSVTRVTRAQDDDLCELIQRGLNSPAYEPGPFNDSYECINRNFKSLYLDMLGK